jgi:hypothetical protein
MQKYIYLPFFASFGTKVVIIAAKSLFLQQLLKKFRKFDHEVVYQMTFK